jgi:hypothetical protein
MSERWYYFWKGLIIGVLLVVCAIYAAERWL